MTDEQERATAPGETVGVVLAANLRRLRRFRDLSQKQIAETLGVHPATILAWERQPPKSCPDMVQGAQLADLYGVSLDALVGRAPLELTVKPKKESDA